MNAKNAHRLAVQAFGLRGEDPLEDVADPGVVVARVAVGVRSPGGAAALLSAGVCLVRGRVVLPSAALAALLLGVPLGDDRLLDVVDEKIQKLVGVVLHVVVEVD